MASPTASIPSGVIGGWFGYRCVRLLAGSPPRQERCGGHAYANTSKVERLLGPRIWPAIRDRVVLDFGCGYGEDAIEIASRGARRVIGLDIRGRVLDDARARAQAAGVEDRCVFTTDVLEPVDVVLSLDAFEHFADPADVLSQMRRLLKPSGVAHVAFGPPWFHPYGGHLFSIFPWAHLVFTERALIRWRSGFKTDGARRFCEVDGGLNGMTVRRFEALVHESGLRVESLEAVPIRHTPRAAHRVLREFVTSLVRCRLAPRW